MTDKRIRVLFFSHCHDLRGGAAQALQELLVRLPADRFAPVVMLPREGEFSATCGKLGIPCAFCPQAWWVDDSTPDAWLYGLRRLPGAVDAVRRTIAAEGIQLVYTNSSVVPAAAMAAALEAVPHVWYIQELLGHDELGLQAAAIPSDVFPGLILLLSSHVIANSRAAAAPYRSETSRTGVSVVYSGVDLTRFDDCGPSREPAIAAIGASTPAKGLDELVQVAANLMASGVDARFHVVGNLEPDAYAQTIRDRINRLGLAEHVLLHGYDRDIAAYFRKSRLVLVPSRSEGMSRVVLEGMAAGLPVVAADSGGPGELVAHEETGFVCPVRDTGAMTEAVSRLLGDEDLARRMGAYGRCRAESMFDCDVAARAIVEQLTTAVERAESSGAGPAVRFMLGYMREAGPRTLLGKKWKLLRWML